MRKGEQAACQALPCPRPAPCRLAPDPASVAGLLHVRKLPSLGAAAPPTPEVSLFLLRFVGAALLLPPAHRLCTTQLKPQRPGGCHSGA